MVNNYDSQQPSRERRGQAALSAQVDHDMNAECMPGNASEDLRCQDPAVFKYMLEKGAAQATLVRVTQNKDDRISTQKHF